MCWCFIHYWIEKCTVKQWNLLLLLFMCNCILEWTIWIFSEKLVRKGLCVTHIHKLDGTIKVDLKKRNQAGGKVECVWNLMAHGDAREGKWRGNWRMEWVASTLTLPRNVAYPALLTPMRTPRLPAVDWTDAPADLNGLVRFGERWNLVSVRVPSHFTCSLLDLYDLS